MIALAGLEDRRVELPGSGATRTGSCTSTAWARNATVIPVDTAAHIVRSGNDGKALPRLRNIWVSDEDYVIIRLDVLCPKPRKPKAGK